MIGLNGSGLSIASNAVNVTVPGTASQYVWLWSARARASTLFLSNCWPVRWVAPVRLPLCAQLDDDGPGLGSNLYFGSAHELMIYSPISNTLSKQDTNAPGVVLAVAPDNSLISRQRSGAPGLLSLWRNHRCNRKLWRDGHRGGLDRRCADPLHRR